MPDTLKDSYVTLATPAWGDDKNGDDSHLDLTVIFTTKDSYKYKGKVFVGDNTGIGPNNSIYPHLDISAFKEKIDYNNISEVELLVEYYYTSSDPLGTDKWDARFEIVMEFESGKFLTSGYNDPAVKLYFNITKASWTLGPVYRSNFFNEATLKPPFG